MTKIKDDLTKMLSKYDIDALDFVLGKMGHTIEDVFNSLCIEYFRSDRTNSNPHFKYRYTLNGSLLLWVDLSGKFRDAKDECIPVKPLPFPFSIAAQTGHV